MPTVYPIVPGHEIVGRVTKVGSAVTKYKPGDLAAVRLPRRFGPHLSALPGGLENLCPNLRLSRSTPRIITSAVSLYGGYSAS